jgi:hypothetical protein
MHLLRDCPIPHRAIGHPWIVSLTSFSQRLLEHMNFNGLLGAIRLWHGDDADEGATPNIRHRSLRDRDSWSVGLERDSGFLAAPDFSADEVALAPC